jgi:diacylglycerol kinase-like protein
MGAPEMASPRFASVRALAAEIGRTPALAVGAPPAMLTGKDSISAGWSANLLATPLGRCAAQAGRMSDGFDTGHLLHGADDLQGSRWRPDGHAPRPAGRRPRSNICEHDARSGHCRPRARLDRRAWPSRRAAIVRGRPKWSLIRSGAPSGLSCAACARIRQAPEADPRPRGPGGPVVIGGRDGTLNAAAPGLIATRLPLHVIPLGTANDLARTLGIPLPKLAASCQ